MTGLFAGLVQRGAGTALQTGAPVLSLRPRSRFEPMPGLPEADAGGFAEATPEVTAPRIESPVDRTPPDTLPPPPTALAATDATLASQLISVIPPSGSLAKRSLPVGSSAAVNPFDPPMPRSPAAAPSPATLPASNMPEALPARSLEPRPIASELSASVEVDEARAGAPLVHREGTPPVALGDGIAPPSSAPMMSPEYASFSAVAEPQPEPLPLQVTIAIERIDIALAPPPAPPAPTRPAIPRTSGFAAYARARRGMPR
jgi:hypothetical protein